MNLWVKLQVTKRNADATEVDFAQDLNSLMKAVTKAGFELYSVKAEPTVTFPIVGNRD